MIGLDQGLIQGNRGILAWANFNGTGTLAVRASFNVSSITDNGAGDYTINFASPMPDRNYVICGVSYVVATAASTFTINSTPTVTSCRIGSVNAAGTLLIDSDEMHVAFLR
jgi:hypothetical protein